MNINWMTSDKIFDTSEEARLDYDYETDLELKRQGIGLEPLHPQVHLNYGLALLRLEYFTEGWNEYKWLHLNPPEDGPTPENGQNCHGLLQPEWDGSSLKNKTILVVCEEGLGDYIQFLRFALALKQDKRMRTKLILLAPPALEALFKRIPTVDRVLIGGEMLSSDEYDYWIATCQLPAMLDVGRPYAIPPYLTFSESNNARWTKLLTKQQVPIKKAPVVGIVWGGNPKHTNDLNRSLKFDCLMPLLDLHHINFVSLQRDDRRHEARNAQELPNFFDAGHLIETFDDSASVLHHCDLLITVDSSPCHLAGALGVLTWVIIPDVPDWRWGVSGDTNLWYDNMRVFRQPEYGTWGEVIQLVKNALLAKFPQ